MVRVGWNLFSHSGVKVSTSWERSIESVKYVDMSWTVLSSLLSGWLKKKINLLRFNLCTTSCIHLKCAIKWVSHTWNHHYNQYRTPRFFLMLRCSSSLPSHWLQANTNWCPVIRDQFTSSTRVLSKSSH